jgi:NADP-dependent 3-hydroxy acid dehydrogenase YdfG
MADFTNQIAVVTGASSGVGKAIALALAAHGATVCLVGRKLAALQSVSGSAGSSRYFSYQADLTKDEEIHELAARLQRDVGIIDLLVHSAGVISLGTVEEAPVEDFDRQYQTNVRGPYVLTQVLLPIFRRSRGEVVFVNSSIGLNSRAGTGQYAATKLALKAIADSLRAEVNADGRRVLSVFLGQTATPMQQTIHDRQGRDYHPERLLQPEDVAAVVLSAVSLPRTAEVTDINIRPMIKTPI